MRAISVHVLDEDYQRFKSLAVVERRPIAELIREAMSAYLEGLRRSGRSVLAISPHTSGRMLEGWDRSELFDEMLER
ncbi:MAG: ribbon-helix-helix protein, CopG family [Thermoanaerobaculia bacterium]|nr:ribbon-helix-helix protein, CopG family [Thermoanaerobaculia bacterium]